MFIDHPTLGRIILIANGRARRVIVRYRDQEFQLTHPSSLSKQKIIESVKKMEPKLLKLRENSKEPFLFAKDTSFSTFSFNVILSFNSLSNPYTSLKDGKLHISYPENTDLLDDNIQTYIKQTVENACKIEAKRILPNKVHQLAQKHNFEVRSIKINKSRGRWGSCSTNKDINLSYYCMMLPEHLIDFVILHELSHTKEMNHSIHFWKILDVVSGEKSAELTAELKKIRLKW